MRRGSKGLSNKNLRVLHGKPLMAHTIEQAQESELFEHIVVSTDSKKIAEMAKSLGAEAWFLRPSKLSKDNAPKIPAIRHAFLESESYFGCKFDVVVDLDVTSPLRRVADITNAYNQLINENADILITGSSARKNPYFNMVEIIEGQVQLVKKLDDPVGCRQDAPKVYDMNASVYIWKRDVILSKDSLFTKKTALYIMPDENSVDIDTNLDWQIVEYLMGNNIE
jgi:CMP-N,N'-diacetyllegionaminic acid synthase